MTDSFETNIAFANWLKSSASPVLKHILQHPDIFRYQLLYTQINRDENNQPSFRDFSLDVNTDCYFNPASTVKMPLAFLALEKINQIGTPGIDKLTAMLTDAAYPWQTAVEADESAANGLPSVAHYIKKIFLVSDNDAYNRLYDFVGQQAINERLWEMGYHNTRIIRRFAPLTAAQNRYSNPIRFVDEKGSVLCQHEVYKSNLAFAESQPILIGKAHYDRNENFVAAPMDFSKHNRAPLKELQQMLQSVLFPGQVLPEQRFQLTEEDYRFLCQCLSELPRESRYPGYDEGIYFDSYAKFFMFRAGKKSIPPHLRIFNKTGWSYGFLTDVAYIVDFDNGVEWMLSGTIYTNENYILNDDQYEYEKWGYPFFEEVGNLVFQYELQRPRKHIPNLESFLISYD